MFNFPKTVDIITLFSKAGSPVSARITAALKQGSIAAASKTPKYRDTFELNITEEPPTEDQVKTILGYVGLDGISKIINGATSEADALKKYKLSPDSFQRPVVVDWNNGMAITGDKESEILKLLNAHK